MKNQIKYIVILIILIISFLVSIFSSNKKIQKQVENQIKDENEENVLYEETDEKIKLQDELIEKVKNECLKKPYIPDDFIYVEGEINEGYVIEDDFGNEYVWIPCNGLDEIQKKDFVEDAFISYKECYDEDFEIFLRSVIENGGFYISRFEIGEKEQKIVSQKDSKLYINLTINEANDIIKNMNTNNSFNIEMINGIAYDIAMDWILDKENEKSVIERKISTEDSLLSGNLKIKNIYDITDNILEYTTEKTYSNAVIIRGFMELKSEKANINMNKFDNRFCILPDEKLENLAIRTILYKK